MTVSISQPTTVSTLLRELGMSDACVGKTRAALGSWLTTHEAQLPLPARHREVPAMYALLDAFVVPRRDERAARLVTPLKPFEAMAMARPFIVADLPALTEVAPDGERSLAYPAEDSAALAAAVARLMDDPALAARLGENGRAWVTRERTWASNGPRWTEVYESVLAGQAARRAGGAFGGVS